MILFFEILHYSMNPGMGNSAFCPVILMRADESTELQPFVVHRIHAGY